MARLVQVALVALLALACTRPPPALKYPTSTPEDAAAAWAKAFNAGDMEQLRLLVHPDRRALFEAHESDVEKQIATFDVQSYEVGEQLVVNEALRGRAVKFIFTDGSSFVENPAVLVEGDRRWWLWRY